MNNEAMIAKAVNGSSTFILPMQHYDMKTQNITHGSHFQTINTDPTKLPKIKSERQQTTVKPLYLKIPNGNI